MPRKTGRPVSWRPRSNRLTDSGTVPRSSVVRLAEALDDIRAERPASDINRRCAHSLCGRLAVREPGEELREIAGGVVERLFQMRVVVPAEPSHRGLATVCGHHDDPTGGNLDAPLLDLRPRAARP